MPFPVRMLLAAVLFSSVVFAETVVEHPFPGVTYTREIRDESIPQVFHLVTIAPDTPGLAFKTTRSNGEAPRDTDTESALAFARRTGVQVAINANFFSPLGEPQANLIGLAASNGKVVSPWDSPSMLEAIHFDRDNRISFIRPANPDRPSGSETNPPVVLHNAVTGNIRVVERGRIPIPTGGDRHPRTLIGLTEDGTLLLLVVDGRRRGISVGATMHECATVLREHGADTAINLDGGGSTTLIIADPEPSVVNRPSGQFGILRSNGNHLGVFAGNGGASAPTPENRPQASADAHTHAASSSAQR